VNLLDRGRARDGLRPHRAGLAQMGPSYPPHASRDHEGPGYPASPADLGRLIHAALMLSTQTMLNKRWSPPLRVHGAGTSAAPKLATSHVAKEKK
jgi:hypothetical protein